MLLKLLVKQLVKLISVTIASSQLVYDSVEQSPHYDNSATSSNPYIDERELIELPAANQ